MTTTLDPKTDLFQPIAETVHHATGLPVSIWIPDDKGKVLRIVASVGLPENYIKTASLDLTKPSVTGDAFKKNKVQIAKDISSDPRWYYKEQAREMKWKSAICVPIQSDGTSIGVISVYAYIERSIPEIKLVLPDFAKQAGLTIAANRQTEIRERILEISLKLQSVSENPTDVLNEIVKAACELTGANSAVVYPYDNECGEFQGIENVAAYGLKEALAIPKKPRTQGGMAADVMRRGEVAVVNLSDQGSSDFTRSSFIQKEGIQAFMGIALRETKTTLGVLYVNFHTPHVFTRKEKNTIRLFAHQASTALRNARYYQQAKSQITALERLHEVGTTVATITGAPENIKNILVRIAQGAQTVLGADLIDLYQYVQNRDWYDLPPIQTGKRNDPSVIKTNIFEDDVIRKVVEKKRPQYIVNSKENKEFTEDFKVKRPNLPRDRFVIREDISSTASIPLTVGLEVVGILFASYRTKQAFSQPQRELIELFAAQAAIAIRNGRMFEQRKTLQEIAKDITGILDKEELLQKTLARSLDLLGCEAGSIALLNKASNQLEFQYAIEKPRYESVLFGKGLIGTAAETKKPVRVGNVRKDSRYIKHTVATRSELDVPMLIGDELIGVLNAESVRFDAFDEDSEELAITLAGQAAIAIHNSRLYSESLQRSKRLELVRKVAAAVSSATDIKTILQLAVDGLAQVFGVKQSAVALFDKADDFAVIQTEHLEPGYVSAMGHSIPLKNNPQITKILETKQPLIVDDVQKDPIMAYTRDIMAVRKTRSLMVVPIVINGEVVGTIGVDAVEEQRHFTKEEAELAQAIANQAAAAILISRQLDERVSDFHALQDITEQMHQGDLDAVLNLIAERAVELTGAKHGGVWLINRTRTALEFGGHANKAQYEQLPPNIPLYGDSENSFSKWVVLNGQSYISSDVREDNIYKPWYKDTRSELTVPIIYQDRVIGTINVESPIENSFTENHKRLLEAMAGQAAIVVQNGQLLERLNVLDDIGVELTSGIRLKEDKILESIHNQAQRLTGAQDMYIALYNENSGEIRFPLATQKGKRIEYPTRKADMKKRGKTEEIIFTRKPILHKTKKEAKKWYGQPGHEEKVGLIQPSWLGVPMMVGERVLGVIAIYDLEQEHAYDEQDLQVFSSMASQAAIALDNANLYYNVNQNLESTNQQLERRVAALASLNNIGNTLTSGIRLKEEKILDLIFVQAQELTGAQDLYIALYDEGTGEIRFPLATEKGKSITYPSRKANMEKRGKTEEIIFTRKPILHKTMREAEKWYSQFSHAEFVGHISPSWLGVPMMVGERILGVIAAVNLKQEYAYDELHLEVLSSMASQAAIALDNARLYEEARGDVVAAKQLATLGTATATLQHRINNTINLIVPNIIRLRKRVDITNPEISNILEIIERNVRYTSDLVKRIQTPLREMEVNVVDINATLSNVVRQKQEELDSKPTKSNIKFIIELDPANPTIKAPVGQVTEVFQNVVDNACRAMENYGELRITNTAMNGKISIRIQDTGPGIRKDIKDRLFYKPVSSDDLSAGAGLGLWLNSLILQGLGGSISIEKTGSNGTIMLVEIPFLS